MKKFYLLLACMCSAPLLFSQTLISYGSNTVSKDEFLKAYNKNKTPVPDRQKALKEYLDLYTNFKLKVKAAKELHLDTLEQIKMDVENFRQQVQDNYIGDEKATKSLYDEAIERSLKDVHALHFSVPVDAAATPADTMKAFLAANMIYDELKSGNKEYTLLTDKVSVTHTKAKNSDLGYLTAFSVPYEFENIIFALKQDEVSKPYRSKNAWHIFKVVDLRKNTGRWKVAQVLFSMPPGASEAMITSIQRKADSVYGLLKSGADFAAIAKTYSDDKLTYQNGGEMPEFGTGKYDYQFENEVHQLKKDGDISKPFRTQYGFHIVKRLENTPAPADLNDAMVQYDIKQKMQKDSRMNIARDKFAKDIATKIGLKKTTAVKDQDLFRYADTVLARDVDAVVDSFPISKKTIITFNKGTAKGSDWLKYVKDYKASGKLKNEKGKDLWNKYVNEASLDYYKKHLEEFNPDFRFQIQEFREGNMLFEAMERNVWSKANNDSAGLLKYYNEHKENYKWAESADVLIFNIADSHTEEILRNDLQSGRDWKEVVGDLNNVQVDSARYELNQLTGYNATNTTPGSYSATIKNSDGSVSFVKFLRNYPADQQRTFEEARGLVINDYQGLLEKQWLATLRKKYPVKVNEAVFAEILK